MSFIQPIKQKRLDKHKMLDSLVHKCAVIEIYKNDDLKSQAIQWLRNHCEQSINEGYGYTDIGIHGDFIKSMPGINEMYSFWENNLMQKFSTFVGNVGYQYILSNSKYMYFDTEIKHLVRSFAKQYKFANSPEWLLCSCFQKKERAYLESSQIKICWERQHYCCF